MTSVSFPYIEPTFKAALSEVIEPYLTGIGGTVGGTLVDFYNCELHWNLDAVNLPSDKPRVCIVGSRASPLGRWKCTGQDDKPLGYVERVTVFRSVYVSAPRSLRLTRPASVQPAKPVTWEDVDRIWSQLYAIFATKHRDLMDRGIYRPAIVPTPQEVPDKEFYILYGSLSCEVRYPLVMG